MPISHPVVLRRRTSPSGIGPFATLGLAEDTWALNEGVTDDATFLQQAYDIDDERAGRCSSPRSTACAAAALVCVFDATDRIQHMFWRYLDAGHPAHAADVPEPHQRRDSRALYAAERRARRPTCWRRLQPGRRADGDLGPRLQRVPPRRQPQRAGCTREGYLALQARRATARAEWLRDVDWSRTRAYCVGLSGHVPQPARPRAGGHRRARRRGGGAEGGDHRRSCSGLRDAERRRGRRARGVRHGGALQRPVPRERARPASSATTPATAPRGTGATGVVAGPVFEDNTKAWSGDHCIDPRLVPGVFFCNRTVDGRGDPALVDIAPTALQLFGIEPPAYMDGRPLGRGVMTGRRAGAGGRLARDRRAARRRGVRPASHADRPPRRSCSGFDGLDYHLVRDLIGAGPAAELRPPRRRPAVHAARHHDAAAEPGGVVHVHHRPRSRRARHLRLHPSRSRRRSSRSCRRRGRCRRAACSRSARWQFPLAGGRVELLRHGHAVLGGARGSAASRPPSSACRPTSRPRAPPRAS